MSLSEPYGWVRPLKDGGWQYYAGPAKAGVWVYGAAYGETHARKAVEGALAGAGFPQAPIHEKRPFGKWSS